MEELKKLTPEMKLDIDEYYEKKVLVMENM